VTARLAALWERPIAERERTRALLAVTALLTAATILLALDGAHGDPPRRALASTAARATAPRPGPSSTGARATAPRPGPSSTGAAPSASVVAPASAARLFLGGYLAYLYGHAPAGAVQGATPGLLRSLRAHPPRVSVDMHARQPRILTLQVTPAASPGHAVVSAQVNDGALEDYPVVLLLAHERGRLLVTGLEGEG
jgi:hypothetical protein